MAFADPQLAPLMRVDPDGTATVAAEDLMFPNGSVITPDGRTLIVGETAGCRYTAFTIADDGSLTDRRVWAQLAPTPALAPLEQMLPQITVGPDGCTLDAEGHIWAADEAGGRCIRVAPGGAIVDEIHAPEGLGCFACALGGDDGRTLLICSRAGLPGANRRPARDAVLLTTAVEVAHAAEVHRTVRTLRLVTACSPPDPGIVRRLGTLTPSTGTKSSPIPHPVALAAPRKRLMRRSPIAPRHQA